MCSTAHSAADFYKRYILSTALIFKYQNMVILAGLPSQQKQSEFAWWLNNTEIWLKK